MKEILEKEMNKMSYPKSFREQTVKYRLQGHTLHEVCEKSGISLSTLVIWIKQYHETGDLSNKPLKRTFKKIDPIKLKQLIAEHPDISQEELAKKFCCSKPSISRALKRNQLKVKRKRRTSGNHQN